MCLNRRFSKEIKSKQKEENKRNKKVEGRPFVTLWNIRCGMYNEWGAKVSSTPTGRLVIIVNNGAQWEGSDCARGLC